FNNIRTNAARCQRLVPFTQLAGDLVSAATTPNFVWITPNMCNDMHDCAIGTGDAWLKTSLPPLFNSPAWQTQSSALFIVGDEDDRFSNNQVALIVVSPLAKHGYQSRARYDHYSLLKTIESAWGLAALTANDSNASPLSDFWK
ncbi:MAG: alkaline phosphatase family protein, partial [Chloroflexota bacterium]